MNALPALSELPASAQLIVWMYLLTNAARIFTYLPQIHAVWASRDGARAIALVTWCSWTLSHVAALAYAQLVAHDIALAAISCINLLGCGTITAIALRRRLAWRRGAAALVPAR
ncbi:hypothetical protein [Pseudorhodoferax sp.]|uniref:hypothetical protein n=1 Tax=Pseudorhodoferax sp. TaxID=1993553 RepID=UPI002DD6A45B|nr:hypothetical protein [Pseudorhodoferax sp.]